MRNIKGFSMKKIMIGRLQSRFVHLVKAYLGANDMTQKDLANKLHIPESHLSNLMTFNSDGYKRVLSCNYTYSFLMNEVFAMNDIYDGKPESPREEECWQVMEVLGDRVLQKKIATLKRRGFNLNAVLDGLLKSTEPA